MGLRAAACCGLGGEGLGIDVRRGAWGFDLMFWRGGVGIYIGEGRGFLGVGDKK